MSAEPGKNSPLGWMKGHVIDVSSRHMIKALDVDPNDPAIDKGYGDQALCSAQADNRHANLGEKFAVMVNGRPSVVGSAAPGAC